MRTVGFLFLLAAIAGAGEFVHKSSGLKLEVPEGWRRDSAREKGRIKFAGFLGIEQGKYVTFEVETVPVTEAFEAAAWLDQQKRDRARHLKQGTQAFTKDNDRSIGGVEAVGFTMSGVHEPKPGQAINLRFRAYAVVTGDQFFQFTEVSVNDAHKAAGDKLPAIWDGVAFQAAEGGEEGGGGDGAEAAEGTETEARDELGNYKTKLPPGWEIERSAPTEDKVVRRMTFVRNDDNGNFVARIEVFKFGWRDPSVFHSGTVNDILETIRKENFFGGYYGEGSREVIRPEMDEGVALGAAEKAGEYVIRSKKMDEIAKIAEAETRVKRGEKGATVPKYMDFVIRGRIAMISPDVYITRATFRRSLADDPQVIAEFKAIHDNWEFLVTGARPQPLSIVGKDPGDTTKDPAAAKARKEVVTFETRGRKTYRVEYKIVLPPGFLRSGGKGGDLAMRVYAQDSKNNWVEIVIVNANSKKAAEEKKNLAPAEQYAGTWKSNWTGKARGTKVPSKIQKFGLGRIKGKGYKLLAGKVASFPGTFSGVVSSKFPGKGWQTIVTVETRGEPVFTEGIKKFFKSIKAKDIKVK